MSRFDVLEEEADLSGGALGDLGEPRGPSEALADVGMGEWDDERDGGGWDRRSRDSLGSLSDVSLGNERLSDEAEREEAASRPWARGKGDMAHFEIDAGPEGEGGTPTSNYIYVEAFFITVAAILGTGILGLPVKLSKSGFAPFLITFVFCLVAQAYVLLFMIELLQRASAVQGRQLPEHAGGLVAGEDFADEPVTLSRGPDLHQMSVLFLGPRARLGFNVAVLVHFVSILVSYALAGSQAYAQMFGIGFVVLITPFVLFYSLAVVFGSKALGPFVSLLTMAKGSLLIFMVFMVGVVSSQVNNAIVDDWARVGEPFLIGTVALGGAINVFPVVFAKIRHNADEVRKFRIAVVAGLALCWFLNILWALFILKIVPQDAPDGEQSLQHARDNGEISTVPLIEVLNDKHPKYRWIAALVDVFIMLSITVSYLTIGMGAKHLLDGYVKSFHSDEHAGQRGPLGQRVEKTLAFLRPRGMQPTTFSQLMLYLVMFGTVLLISLANPKGFLLLLEYATSMALNLEAGFFVAMMMITARSGAFGNVQIPLPLSARQCKMTYFVIGFFGLAVFYDLIMVVMRVAGVGDG